MVESIDMRPSMCSNRIFERNENALLIPILPRIRECFVHTLVQYQCFCFLPVVNCGYRKFFDSKTTSKELLLPPHSKSSTQFQTKRKVTNYIRTSNPFGPDNTTSSFQSLPFHHQNEFNTTDANNSCHALPGHQVFELNEKLPHITLNNIRDSLWKTIIHIPFNVLSLESYFRQTETSCNKIFSLCSYLLNSYSCETRGNV